MIHFLEDKKLYSDLSSDLILGINRVDRNYDNTKYVKSRVRLRTNESEDVFKKKAILRYINDDLFLTSDLHINHKNRNSENFKNIILNEINLKVPINGAIMFLGDMGKKDDINQKQSLKDFISKINCRTIILILGNHDILSLRDYYDIGFTFVTDRIETSEYVFTHFPENTPRNKINFHGHIHEETEYFNIDPKNHINCYVHSHGDTVYTIRDYKRFYDQGKYKDNHRVTVLRDDNKNN